MQMHQRAEVENRQKRTNRINRKPFCVADPEVLAVVVCRCRLVTFWNQMRMPKEAAS